MVSTRTSATKLGEALAAADAAMRPYRRNRLMFLRQYAGPYYGRAHASGVGPSPEPLNMIHAIVSVVLPHLVACNPRAMIRTHSESLRPFADVFALAWNHLAAEIDLARALRTVVTDALFGAGIMKTGLAAGAPVEGLGDGDGYLHDNGRPFADPVDLDDYLIDPHARSREQAAFEGNRYHLSRQYVLDSGLYDRGLAERMPAASADDLPRRLDGRAEDLSRGASAAAGASSDLVEYVELADVWLPNENVVVTIPATGEPRAYLREAPWEGPDRGPYEMLGFHWLPSNVLPVPPLGALFDLHAMINKTARRLGRQADRQKDLVLFDERAAEEAQRLRDALDGEMLGVQNVDRYKQVSFGGPHEEGYKHLAFLYEQFSRIGGNVDLLGGLSPMSNTLGQDEMLFANASVRVEDMRSQVYEFTKHVGTKLAWYLWHDPLADVPLVLRSADGREAMARFSWDSRQGDWPDYRFDVEPHSMNPDTPTRKYRRVLEWIQNVILPTAPIAAAQGLRLDVARLAKLTGSMLNIEEAPEIFVRSAPSDPPAAAEPTAPTQLTG